TGCLQVITLETPEFPEAVHPQQPVPAHSKQRCWLSLALRSYEAGDVRESLSGVYGIGELDQPVVVIVIPPNGAECGTPVQRAKQLRLSLAETHGLNALLDARDTDPVHSLEHRGDRTGQLLQVLLEVRQAQVDVRGRYAHRT